MREGDGTYRLLGNSRAYLVQDVRADAWSRRKYSRFDLSTAPLQFRLDLSQVPCGCLACVYLVAMREPSQGASNYCDMAENVAPGYGGSTCYEIDLLEANNHAMQAAIHTEVGGSFGSGQCDVRMCSIMRSLFARALERSVHLS